MDLKTIAAVCILAMLVLPGCASNTKYVPCCQRGYIVNLSSSPLALLDSTQCILDNNENFSFECDAASISDLENGTISCRPWGDYCVLASINDCAKRPGCVWDGSCRVAKCEEIPDELGCNSSKCQWNQGAGACEPGAAYVTMPVCVDDVQKSCTNEKCKAMMCGYTEVVPMPPVSSQDYKSDMDADNMPFHQQSESPINLAGTACTFKVMDKKLNNMVKNSKGALWVNAFRFGVGKSFSNFEESRYFFPSTDAQCTGTIIPNSKQRYVTYNNANDTWCSSITGSYYNCDENGQNFTDIATCELWCKDVDHCVLHTATVANPMYWCRESDFAYDERTMCKNNCEIVSDPNSCTLSNTIYPFLENNGNFKMTEDGSKINSTYYSKKLIEQYRPVGVSVHELAEFECTDGGQCMSLYCSTSEYMRGRCLNVSNNRRIDCGCGLMNGEKRGLDCSEGMQKTDGTSYTMYRSVLKDTFDSTENGGYWGRERSTGDYNRGRDNSGAYFFNPYYHTTSGGQFGGTVNHVEQTVTLFDEGNVGGEVAGERQNVYRVYVDGGPATNPRPTSGPDIKLFKNCEIRRTDKIGLYAEDGIPLALPSHIDLSEASDGLGPKAQKMCIREFVKATPKYARVNHYWTHYDEMLVGIVPTDGAGNCPEVYGNGGSDPYLPYQFGTRDEGSNHDRYKYFKATSFNYWFVNPRWFWVYEFIFNDTNTQVGSCNISSKSFQPYIDVETVGWCEGCTYSTLAKQSISKDSTRTVEIGMDQYLSYKDQVKRYQQANVMSVFDVQGLSLTYESSNRVYPSFDAASLLCGYSPISRDWHENPPKGSMIYAIGSIDLLSADKGDLAHEYNTAAAQRLQLSRYVPSGAETYMKMANLGAGDCAEPHDDGSSLSKPFATAETYPNLRGKGAFMARALFLKTKCPIAPLTGLVIEDGSNMYDHQSVSARSQLQTLVGNSSTLFNYFYSKREANTCYRVANAKPDYWPDQSVDIFLQNWHPMCENGNGAENKTKFEFESRLNLSLALLSNYSKPSLIWKFSFPDGHDCDESYFLDYLFKHKGDMVDAGIIGLIYDNWKNGPIPDGYEELQHLEYSEPPFFHIISRTRSGTPFCALQNSSRKVLGISKHTYGQKVYATNETCVCESCTDEAYASGTCNFEYEEGAHPPTPDLTPQLFCNDGTRCTLPEGVNESDYWQYYCAPTCMNYTACNLCEDYYSDTTAWCRVETSDNVYKTEKSYSNITKSYWDVLAALPAQDKCCLEQDMGDGDMAKYTYVKRESAVQRTEFLQYPKRGESGQDCGRTPDTSTLTYCDVEIPADEKSITCWKVD